MFGTFKRARHRAWQSRLLRLRETTRRTTGHHERRTTKRRTNPPFAMRPKKVEPSTSPTPLMIVNRVFVGVVIWPGAMTLLVLTEMCSRIWTSSNTWFADKQAHHRQRSRGLRKNIMIRHFHQPNVQCGRGSCANFYWITTGTSGRNYDSPKRKGRRLVLYTKIINLPSPNKYDTSEIVMFLFQV